MSKKKKSIEPSRKLSAFPVMPDLTAFRIPTDVSYGIFVSLGLFLTTLFYGLSLQVGAIDVPAPPISFQEARLESRLHHLVTGYPIADMTPFISQQDATTAAFMVGIAKKESNWGKRVPTLGGEDCYNYWGYRGEGSRGIAMGHGCFGSPEEAVDVVAGRLHEFVADYHFDTPEELVVWKCGWSCEGHSSRSVKKWIRDVGYYADEARN